ncbi:hypothetical protein ABMA70_10295 [Halobacteriovorax sp. XZX-3]|uniref:Ppx/GppA phosphatase family protein n=1 Tax=unclassified Halobacteriovorax TaxID=2639665 RepID=UPI000CD0ADBC|nr:hypothetical protein [Halobacteriovorax sp. DA5]POB13023.1 hypothetical protein C0Z22_10910 [Halobacteriovorax sp. DA5]
MTKNLIASVDIGSNSTLLLVIDRDTKEIVQEFSTITGLGRGLDKEGVFQEKSMEDTFKALKEYKEECLRLGCKNIIITATEASRVAKNAPDFFSRIKSELDLDIEIISGEGEAFYTAFGINEMMKKKSKKQLILDVGGASSELILIKTKPFEIIETVSLPIGSVRVDDWIRDGQLRNKIDEIFESFNLESYLGQDVIGVAGTLTSLALMFSGEDSYNAEAINEYSISLADFNESTDRIQLVDSKALGKQFAFLGKRSKTIQSGAICAQTILNKIEAKNIHFSTYGLRYGTALRGEIDDVYRV